MKIKAVIPIFLAAAAIALAAQTDAEIPQQEPVEVERPLIAGATAELVPDLPEMTTQVVESPTQVAEAAASELAQPVEQVVEQPLVESSEESIEQPAVAISEDELTMLAACVQAEAGNQGEQGMRYVCDVILNRMDSEDYPDTITGVVTQKGQFAVWPKAIYRHMPPDEEVKELCLEEMENRCNSEIIMFRTGHFHTWGTPQFQYKAHYFSSK